MLQPEFSESLQRLAYKVGVKNNIGPSDAIRKINLNFILPIISGSKGRLNGPTISNRNHLYYL